MATTIQTTGLDFNSIKNNLKTYLQATNEFADYNFEASGLSNLLDVLAYNTHYNALIANFALNESYLSTAQLRSSLVGLSTALGYIPGSKTGATATVEISVTDPSGPPTYTMEAGQKFTATIDGQAYTFQTTEALFATKIANNYSFKNSANSDQIVIREGTKKIKTFIAGTYSDTESYVIPDEDLDLSSIIVRVYTTATDTDARIYNNINDVSALDEESQIYILREAPNGYYELSFGDGNSLGVTPVAGNRIEVEYFNVNGTDGNGATSFIQAADDPFFGLDINVTTVSNSAGGSNKESIESIRKNAPFLYASQNRMVTAEDYASLVNRNYGTYIADIKAWGGEDNIPQDVGSVYLSIKYNDPTSQSTIESAITALAADLSVASFTVKYTDPIETAIRVACSFQYNQQLSSYSSNRTAQQGVLSVISDYFAANLGKFDQSFRRSNLLTEIDANDSGILSSRVNIKMIRTLTAGNEIDLSAKKNYQIVYPAQISFDLDDTTIVETSRFVFNNRTCKIVNALNSNVLQIIDVSNGKIVNDNIGYFDGSNGTVYLVGFKPSTLEDNLLKIIVVPANQGAITPTRENILVYDNTESTALAEVTNSV